MTDPTTLATIQRAWQRTSRQALHPSVQARLQRAVGSPFSPSARLALINLDEHGGVRISDLAALSAVDISTMSRTLRPLHEAGLVSRQPGDDLRAVQVAVTLSGKAMVERIQLAGQEMLAEVLSSWAPADQEELARLLTRFSEDFAARLSYKSEPAPTLEVALP